MSDDKRKNVYSIGKKNRNLPFHPAVRAGDFIFVSGQVAKDAKATSACPCTTRNVWPFRPQYNASNPPSLFQPSSENGESRGLRKKRGEFLGCPKMQSGFAVR